MMKCILPNAPNSSERNAPPVRLEIPVNFANNISTAHKVTIPIKWNHK